MTIEALDQDGLRAAHSRAITALPCAAWAALNKSPEEVPHAIAAIIRAYLAVAPAASLEEKLNWIRLGARAMRHAAEADCGNHSESCLEGIMTDSGLRARDKDKLNAEANAADEIRKQIHETPEDSALGYASYIGSEEDRASLSSLGVTGDWLYRRENGVPSRKEIYEAEKAKADDV